MRLVRRTGLASDRLGACCFCGGLASGAPRERLCRRFGGQMTVELAVALPVLVIIAVIAVNVTLFLGECAAYDNAFREAVRVHATSPAYGEGAARSLARVDAVLAERFDGEFERSSVSVAGSAGGKVTFTGMLTLRPTLFGMGLRSSVLGVSLPSMTHAVSFAVDSYKPGVFL